jgi:S-formylglutathione hydrolase FrmB
MTRRGAALGLVAVLTAATAIAQASPQRATQDAGRGSVITDTLWSQALGASKSIVVYLPPSYAANPGRRYPVAYYLHGATGDETNWSRQGRLGLVMDSLVAAGRPEMIVAMPDGDPYSFYTTYNLLLDAAGCRRVMLPDTASAATIARDCVAWPHYDDYIAYDVVRHIDTKYRTLASRDRRAIAGLSMGGYGAISLALRYPAIFAAAASHSGVISPLEFAPAPFEQPQLRRSPEDSARFARIKRGFAPATRAIFGTDSAGWYSRDPATIAARLKASGTPLPHLFVDSGTEDVYTPQSRAFRDAMQARGIPLEYREWPGAHTWTYWRAHVGESLTWIGARIGSGAPTPR